MNAENMSRLDRLFLAVAGYASLPSAHVGVVGKREVFAVEVLKVVPCDTAYGLSYLHIMRDPAGNALKWFSSKGALEEGAHYAGKATVKDHGEYNGKKQTSLTRCAFERVADPAPAPPPARPEPPPGSWAAVARVMADGDDSGFDWDAWKDEMKEGHDGY